MNHPPLRDVTVTENLCPTCKAFLGWFTVETVGKAADGHPLPLATQLLYTVCNGDTGKFEALTEGMRLAFHAGRAFARKYH